MIGTKKLLRVAPLALAFAFTLGALANESAGGLALQNDVDLGEILVDSAGNTLYLFLPDAQGESTCYDACAENWPPLLVAAEASLGEGIDQQLVSAVERTDGTEQVTYGGWPLYTFASDAKAGETNGQGVNDAWFVVSADGAPVGAPADGAAEGADGGGEAAEGQADGAGDDEQDAESQDAAPDVAEGDMEALMSEGATVFARICAACHGANGDESLAEHVAILADNSKLENERRVLRRVIHGGGYMPQFGNVLSDREVAAVVTFVRNSWGNDYGAIGEEDAAEAR